MYSQIFLTAVVRETSFSPIKVASGFETGTTLRIPVPCLPFLAADEEAALAISTLQAPKTLETVAIFLLHTVLNLEGERALCLKP